MQNSLNGPQTPKNFFLQIGIIASLYASAVSFLVFIFAVIDKVLPKALEYYNYGTSYNDSIRFSISVLIITFPLFIWLGRLYRNFVQENADMKESKLRRWVIYFSLFITGLTMAIDAIVLINTFLQGEDFALNFFLKFLSVFLVALTIFIYCIKDLKGYFDANIKMSKIWSATVSAVVLISIVIGFVLVGSPTNQRNIAKDNQRVVDLQNIQWQIVSYYQQKGILPATLEQVKDPLSGSFIPLDPDTKTPYTYRASSTSALSFELCANFATENMGTPNSVAYDVYEKTMPANGVDENWQHGVGEKCFVRTIDPERYPRIKNQI